MLNLNDELTNGILFTDQYELTMAQVYFKMGLHEKKARFEHFFRRYPDYGLSKAGYCINAGLEWLIAWMLQVRFREKDLDILRTQKNKTGQRVFDDDFVESTVCRLSQRRKNVSCKISLA